MKKPMKFKRYEGGGEISGEVDPKEAADKEAGLKASKGEDVGFFKRLRMGNIDDPNSEAYKRFGAGRGRSERNPVNESVSVNEPMAVARPSMKTTADDMYSDYGVKAGRGSAGTSETVTPSARVTPSKPAASKPTASKPSTTSRTKVDNTAMMEANAPAGYTGQDMRGITSESRSARRSYNEPPVGNAHREEEKTSKAPVDETKLSLSERMKLSRERSKTGSGPTDTRSVSERVRSTFGMKSGGSVSSASRRADGIATKGKTRGKIC